MTFILPCFLLLSAGANAAWVELSTLHNFDTQDSMEMGEALGSLTAEREWLNAHNLTGESRLKVTQIKGKVARFRWENDANCSVRDPSGVPPVTMSSSSILYMYQADPATVWELITEVRAPAPCGVPSPPGPRFNTVRK